MYCFYSLLNDLWISNIKSNESLSVFLSAFTILEYSFFSIFIYSLLESTAAKKAILVISMLFVLSSIFIYFNNQNTPFDAIPASIEAVILISFTIYLLFEQNNKPEISLIYLSYTFWITFGFLIYLSGTFFLFVQYSNLPEETQDTVWSINLVCNILKNILFAIAFSMRKEDSKPNSI